MILRGGSLTAEQWLRQSGTLALSGRNIQSNKAEIEKLIKQHEIDIANLRENHSLEMQAKENEHRHRILEMEKESELRVKEQGQNLTNNAMGNILATFMQDILSNPTEAKGKLDQLKKIGE
ncbi:MAG: hypothetical protein LBI64_01730 [Coriobacteriales bacterium]|nr:hypothetical protein [Coriobacteriales bacterium]